MDEVWKTLTSPAWWITAVLFGIVINIVSAYLKGPIDQVGTRLSDRWQRRTELSRRQQAEHVQRLRLDQNLQFHAQLHALRLRSQANTWLILGILVLVNFGNDFQVLAYESLAALIAGKAGPAPFDVPLSGLLIACIAFFAATKKLGRAKLLEHSIALAREEPEISEA